MMSALATPVPTFCVTALRSRSPPRHADARAHCVEPALAEVFGLKEEQVLEQAGEPRAPRHLAQRADVSVELHSDHRIGAVHVEN